MRLGFGDVLTAAQQALVNAGYANSQCEVQKVCTPAGDCYTQNVCSSPGFEQGFDANLALQMTPAQLAAQKAYELNAGGGNAAQDYFQWSNPAPFTSVLQSTSGGASAPAASTSTTTAANQVNQVAKQTAGQSQPPVGGTTAPPAGNTSTGNSANQNNTATQQTSSLIPGVPDVVLYIGGALALFMILKGK